MAVSYTTTYNLTKPEVGASEDQWGGLINDNLDDLDNLLDGTTPVTGIDINSGTIDGTVIGGAAPAAISATSLGIGTSSPSALVHVSTETAGGAGPVEVLRLEVKEASGGALDAGDGTKLSFFVPEGDGISQEGAAIATVRSSGSDTNAASSLVFYTAGDDAAIQEAMRIDSSGNVGIGTSSPAATLSVDTSTGAGQVRIGDFGDFSNDTSLYMRTSGLAKFMNVSGGAFAWGPAAGTEHMRIDASGNLLVGTTAKFNFGRVCSLAADGVASFETKPSSNISYNAAYFLNSSNGQVGRILCTGSSTSYVTSSDYRLKTDAQPMTGASARVQALNPVNFAWKDGGHRVDGFLAHEAQEVVPEAVTGTKDAMRDEEYEVTPAVYEDVVIPAVLDEEGNELEAERTEQRLVSEAVMGTRSVPDYQGIDQSKLVPLLTAALQEALTEIADLKARVTALEA